MVEASDLVQLVQEADLALIQMEQARSLVDQAKLNFELAKEDLEKTRAVFDQVIAKADDFGVPRAKLKKLAEERSSALLISGLLSTPANGMKPKPSKPSKKTKEPKPVLEVVPPIDFEGDSSEAVLN